MNWDDVKVFLAIARSGSVRGAANALSVSHSTVLRRLDALEESVGITLFSRLPNGYEPTKDGEALFDRAVDIERQAFAFEREAVGYDQDKGGKITVTMPEPIATHYLAEHFGRFRELYPRTELDVIFTYDVLDLTRRAADVAIRFSNTPDQTLVGRQQPRFEEAYYATPDYMERYDLSDPEGGAFWIGWREAEDWVTASPYPKLPVRWRLANVSVQLAACRAGFGMAQLPCFMGDRCEDLIRVPGSALAPGGFDVWILYHEDLKSTPRITALCDFLSGVMKSDADLLEGRQPRQR
ncbi:MAG: LysR family transcriptional regulator [Pseudomonadota bacterium]